MFNKGESYSDESKFVANILSGMAAVPSSTGTSSYSIPSTAYSSGITSTPTLTPTTLANIERTFIELQAVPPGVNSSNGQDPHTQSGFVPPIVDPAISDRSNDYDYSDDNEWVPNRKRARIENGSDTSSNGKDYSMSNSQPTRKRRSLRDDKLAPEEEARRRVRRERNKVAAAKCRQRRVDHTNRLQDETDVLDTQRDDLEAEIVSLQQQKDQMEFILQAHRPLCKRHADDSACNHAADRTSPVITAVTLGLNSEKSKVKTETINSTCIMGKNTKTSLAVNAVNGMRPMTLNIKKEKPETPGIPITTPSSGYYFTMDMDHTGLTPITNGPITCCNEVNRTSSESSAEKTTSPTLISL